MLNTNREENLKLVATLKKDGYTDLGWGNDGKEFSVNLENRISPITELDCSMYARRGTHKVYVDHDNKEILHIDTSD